MTTAIFGTFLCNEFKFFPDFCQLWQFSILQQTRLKREENYDPTPLLFLILH